ncbi:rhodanese family protein [Phenylobacterium sp. J367]|uniref:rhodanese family protein n=1 Tax=Phenylobacterium sp. J367 TaxID=2898435 RepID=UPI0021518127|nr:rhodanese family protein [Phenylobacterium sp. J367]MCR5877139.1 rhodanese family protein [Phenylobacterium sp. J367]
MTASLTTLTPKDVADRLKAGKAVLVDIREPDEYARRHVQGALSRPLSGFETAHLGLHPDRDVVFTCRSGMRTQANCDRLAARVDGPAYILEGGVDAWSAAGLPVVEDRKAPLEMIRQVQIGAGLLVLTGVALGFLVHPGFFGLSAFVGAGLTFAGATGFCGMAKVLALAPWNRRAA